MFTENKFINISLFLIISFIGINFSYAQANKNTDKTIQKIIDNARARYDIPGIEVSISFPGEESPHDFVSGTTALKGTAPVRSNTLFQMGSETKSFTATILLQLEAEGLLSIDDPIGKWLPNILPAWKNITVRQLLNHTSGIVDFTDTNEYLNTLRNDFKKQWTADELIKLVVNKPAYFAPGKGYHYSSTNYVLAGMVIHSVTGKPIEEAMRTRLIEPLHLSNTYYILGLPSKNILERMAHGYSRNGMFPVEPKDVTDSNLSSGGAAGAIISTSHDIAIWFRKLISGSILPIKQQNELISLVDMKNGQPIFISSKKPGYGLGILRTFDPFKKSEVWMHAGGTLGYSSYMIWLKCYDVVITTAINDVQKNGVDSNALLNDLILYIQKSSKQCKDKSLKNSG